MSTPKNRIQKIKYARGQISVFLALIFLILFSLFGMTISMGMFIHDKVNLQNSTDLASYYVASKQAELLGAIAHSNYQIRQSWKLLAFRYRVIGQAARTEGENLNPGLTNATGVAEHTVYPPAAFNNGNPPKICIAATHVFKETQGDTLCKDIDFSVAYVNNIPEIISIGIVGKTNDDIDAANLQLKNSCNGAAYANWWFANTIVGSHKLEQRDRRAVIEALARNLALPIVEGDGGMRDINGDNIYEGARKTFEYNLTESNRENQDAEITFENSLQGLEPSAWLPPIHINTVVPWSFFSDSAAVGNREGCREEVHPHLNAQKGREALSRGDNSADARRSKQALDPSDLTEQFGSLGSSSADPLADFSVGVEKNPWVMVYNKATGRASSKPVFLADVFNAQGIPMQAIAYAKPFGGRIGPWYNKLWPQGSPTSGGGGKTDPLMPNRVDVGGLGRIAGSAATDVTLQPNYSRHPGDEAGLTTRASQVFAGKLIDWPFVRNPPQDQVKSSIADYRPTTYSYFGDSPNDPLAQNVLGVSGAEPWESFNRSIEIAAIRPDAFDMTYYSISPNFYDYFVRDKLANWLQLPPNVELRGDAGFRADGPTPINAYDIAEQMQLRTADGIDRSARAAWVNTGGNVFALLTGWMSGSEVMDYGAADQSGISNRFANCTTPVPGNGDGRRPRLASECVSGGRHGYSVKMISSKYLNSELPIGGEGATGRITNPL